MKIDAGKLGKPTSQTSSAYLTAMFTPSANVQSIEIPIAQLTPWQDNEYKHQPFRPYTPEKLTELAENIAEHGVITPIFLRPYGQGYQILAGHNRVAAAKLAGLTTIPAVIRDLDDDEAKIVLTDSNLYQREKLLHSEKAWAYRIRLEVLNKQGQRTDLTSTQRVYKCMEPKGNENNFPETTLTHVVSKLRSSEQLGLENQKSRETVRRYIRLTYLIQPLLDKVDEETIPFTSGVALSYLDEARQTLLWTIMQEHLILKLSRAQGDELKSFADDLDEKLILRILGLSTPLESPKLVTFKVPSDILPPKMPKKLFQNAEFQHRFVLLVDEFLKKEV